MIEPVAVIEIVCRHFDVTPQELAVKTRKRRITEPRQVLLIIRNCGYNISLNHSKDDLPLSHSAVAHSRSTVVNLYDTDKAFRERLDVILQELNFSKGNKTKLFKKLRRKQHVKNSHSKRAKSKRTLSPDKA